MLVVTATGCPMLLALFQAPTAQKNSRSNVGLLFAVAFKPTVSKGSTPTLEKLIFAPLASIPPCLHSLHS